MPRHDGLKALVRGGANEAGGDGADGRGGGLATHFGGIVVVSGGTVDHNQAVGGEGGSGGRGGDGLGGGLFNDASSVLSLAGVTVQQNLALGGGGNDGGSEGSGIGGGVYTLGTFDFDTATVIKKNHSSTSRPNTFP